MLNYPHLGDFGSRGGKLCKCALEGGCEEESDGKECGEHVMYGVVGGGGRGERGTSRKKESGKGTEVVGNLEERLNDENLMNLLLFQLQEHQIRQNKIIIFSLMLAPVRLVLAFIILRSQDPISSPFSSFPVEITLRAYLEFSFNLSFKRSQHGPLCDTG